MRWYIPTWNGDLRLEPDGEGREFTRVVIFKPTTHELLVLKQLLQRAIDESWFNSSDTIESHVSMANQLESTEFRLMAPLEKVGPVAVKLMRPGPAVLTAVRFADGHIETSDGSEADLRALAERGVESEGKDAPSYRDPPSDKKASSEPKKSDKQSAAATVKRPTPCCPQCVPDSIGPAREVLLSFLTPEEHETWARGRYLIVTGGLSGHRYAIAHRNSLMAQRFGRICYDLDDQGVMHFHDWSVPPEEEVLATKLILEHREPWLRNEATTLFAGPRSHSFKNPFGGFMDGVADATATRQVGTMALAETGEVARAFDRLITPEGFAMAVRDLMRG